MSYPDLDSDPRFIDWVDYAQRVKAADPAEVADKVWTLADGRPVVLGYSDTYDTHREACPAFLAALSEGHRTETLLSSTGQDAFENMSLVRLDP